VNQKRTCGGGGGTCVRTQARGTPRCGERVRCSVLSFIIVSWNDALGLGCKGHPHRWHSADRHTSGSDSHGKQTVCYVATCRALGTVHSCADRASANKPHAPVSSASLRTGWRSLASWRHPATDSTARARPASPSLRLRAPPRARSRRRTAHRRSPLQGQRHSMSTSHAPPHAAGKAASTSVLVRAHTRREPRLQWD
jgi:hypothetical protein